MNQETVYHLARGFSFRGHLRNATVEETHISWVLLDKKYAFKIKKPVKLSFLDFSTLGLRKRYCQRELRLNKRFSTIYESVLPLRHLRGEYSIGGSQGRILDYAVVMKRMDSHRRMDLLLSEGKVKASDVLALARQIAGIHIASMVKHPAVNVLERKQLFSDILRIKKIVKDKVGIRYSRMLEYCVATSNESLDRYCVHLRRRVKSGYIRDVHGDLHSGNIFLYRTPVLFDCIEFNDRLRRRDGGDRVSVHGFGGGWKAGPLRALPAGIPARVSLPGRRG